MKTYPIPAPLLQELGKYLQERPWREVNGFLQALGKIATEVDFPLQKSNGEDQPSVQ
jgi:hypothetical protein